MLLRPGRAHSFASPGVTGAPPPNRVNRMSLIRSLKGFLSNRPSCRTTDLDPAEAYDLWAATYDDQPANLMLQLEAAVFDQLLAQANLHGKTVLDIGCGTGRNWPKILAAHPALLTGCDVSAEMLRHLQQKHPDAKTLLLPRNSHALPEVNEASVGAIVSTLAAAHIPDLRGALVEWNRVLEDEGEVLITDYHPAALARGADRTFRCQGQTIRIKNHVHPLSEMKRWMRDLGWAQVQFIEREIDESMKPAYEAQGALRVYERFLHVPILYGWRLRKHVHAA